MRWAKPGWETEQGQGVSHLAPQNTLGILLIKVVLLLLYNSQRDWQKGEQIVCLPSDKEHWLRSTEMVSNVGSCIFWPQRGTTCPALISGEFLMAKWRILWRFQEKYRCPGQLSLFQATREAVTQYIMACLGCQQSHTVPGQSPAWPQCLHHTTVAKAHQLHS